MSFFKKAAKIATAPVRAATRTVEKVAQKLPGSHQVQDLISGVKRAASDPLDYARDSLKSQIRHAEQYANTAYKWWEKNNLAGLAIRGVRSLLPEYPDVNVDVDYPDETASALPAPSASMQMLDLSLSKKGKAGRNSLKIARSSASTAARQVGINVPR